MFGYRRTLAGSYCRGQGLGTAPASSQSPVGEVVTYRDRIGARLITGDVDGEEALKAHSIVHTFSLSKAKIQQ